MANRIMVAVLVTKTPSLSDDIKYYLYHYLILNVKFFSKFETTPSAWKSWTLAIYETYISDRALLIWNLTAVKSIYFRYKNFICVKKIGKHREKRFFLSLSRARKLQIARINELFNYIIEKYKWQERFILD